MKFQLIIFFIFGAIWVVRKYFKMNIIINQTYKINLIFAHFCILESSKSGNYCRTRERKEGTCINRFNSCEGGKMTRSKDCRSEKNKYLRCCPKIIAEEMITARIDPPPMHGIGRSNI